MSLQILDETSAPSPVEQSSQRVPFFSLTREELGSVLEERLGVSRYRADQLYQWVYQKGVMNPLEMTNIKKSLREELVDLFDFADLSYAQREISTDGTRKYLFEVSQGHQVESVMIKQENRMTLCVSSQVGCALGCKFCQTGTMGLTRHLSTDEIMKQVIGVVADAKNFDDMFSNVVFMGMGEPLHNIDNVLRTIKIMNDDFGLGLSARKITVSTVGLVNAIKKFAHSGTEANLAVSLNATTDAVRERIMPINARHNIAELLQTLREMPLKPRKRVTIEYVMLQGVNDSDDDLRRLPRILRGIPAKINLIPYNNNAGLGFEAPATHLVHRWQKELMKCGFVVTIRWSKGQDINAACGQLVTASTKKPRLKAERESQRDSDLTH